MTELQNSTASDARHNALGFSVAVCNLFYEQRDILAHTIPREKVLSILDLLYAALPEESSLQAAASRALVKELAENRSMYYSMINRAYDRRGDAESGD